MRRPTIRVWHLFRVDESLRLTGNFNSNPEKLFECCFMGVFHMPS